MATDLPLSVRERRAFIIEGQPPASADLSHVVAHDWLMGAYFDAMGIGLRRGRFLPEQDSAHSEPVVVINETMARQFWPGLEPIGQRVAWGGVREHGPWMRIVGIVADVNKVRLVRRRSLAPLHSCWPSLFLPVTFPHDAPRGSIRWSR